MLLQTHSRQPQPRGSAKGFALIAVLWLVSLLTLLATAAAVMSVSHRRASQRLAERVTLEASADSAIRLVVLRIVAPASSGEPITAGKELQIETPAGPVAVTVGRERERIDLNTADEQLLFALFAANGWEAPKARAMVARMEDWIDADDEPRKEGAEARDYAAVGRPYGPRNGAFESVEELRQVLGSEDISPALFDAFTVYTHERVPAASVASAPVMSALRFAEQQHLGDHTWVPEGGIVAADASRIYVGEVLRVRACAGLEGAQRCRMAVIRVTGSSQHPLQVYSWRSVHDAA